MADGFVQVATDGAGKKLQTFENTVNGVTNIHASAVGLVDSAGNPIGTGIVRPAAADRGLITRPIPHGGTPFSFWTPAAGVVAGATGTAALVSLTRGRMDGSAPDAAATTFTLSANKRFRFTQIALSIRGHATATAATIELALVASTAGAVAAGSNKQSVLGANVPAVSNAVAERLYNPTEGIEFLGGATFNFGLVVTPTFVTNAPTYWVHVQGYEY